MARDESLVDFGTYVQILKPEIELIQVYDPREHGLENVEGAILTGERHVVIREAKSFFEKELCGNLVKEASGAQPDWEIDCTFCARDRENIDRYEPCLTVILKSKAVNKAVTIMDGPFPSIYPWDEEKGLSSLTSAKYTPIERCKSWEEADAVLQSIRKDEVEARADAMFKQIGTYWPQALDLYEIVDCRFGIRAMPKSAADARLVDIIETGPRALRVRASKIDAVIHAERALCERMRLFTPYVG